MAAPPASRGVTNGSSPTRQPLPLLQVIEIDCLHGRWHLPIIRASARRVSVRSEARRSILGSVVARQTSLVAPLDQLFVPNRNAIAHANRFWLPIFVYECSRRKSLDPHTVAIPFWPPRTRRTLRLFNKGPFCDSRGREGIHFKRINERSHSTVDCPWATIDQEDISSGRRAHALNCFSPDPTNSVL